MQEVDHSRAIILTDSEFRKRFGMLADHQAFGSGSPDEQTRTLIQMPNRGVWFTATHLTQTHGTQTPTISIERVRQKPGTDKETDIIIALQVVQLYDPAVSFGMNEVKLFDSPVIDLADPLPDDAGQTLIIDPESKLVRVPIATRDNFFAGAVSVAGFMRHVHTELGRKPEEANRITSDQLAIMDLLCGDIETLKTTSLNHTSPGQSSFAVWDLGTQAAPNLPREDIAIADMGTPPAGVKPLHPAERAAAEGPKVVSLDQFRKRR